ncbi:hypothetical protein ZWY2020_008670 [Hordeum vulgare]|nr:hypothetical protein ZWY2020_008670 [Hordeum vulgare]
MLPTRRPAPASHAAAAAAAITPSPWTPPHHTTRSPINTPDAHLHGRKPTAAASCNHPSISHHLLLLVVATKRASSQLKDSKDGRSCGEAGRELQRYSASTGGRIVVGCIPYRVREGKARASWRCW